MVKCQQRLEFMRIYRISFHMSLYQLIPAVKENRKRNCANAKCKIYGTALLSAVLKTWKRAPLISVWSIRAKNTAARTYLFHAKRWVHHPFCAGRYRILFCRRSDLEPYSRTDVCNLSKWTSHIRCWWNQSLDLCLDWFSRNPSSLNGKRMWIFQKSISTSCTGSENNPETHRLYAES